MHELGSYKPEDINKVKEYKALVSHTAKIFNNAVQDNDIPAAMLNSLKNDIYLFSGLRTHAELFEASRQLLTEDGQVKGFNQFSRDIAKIKDNYNQTYLEAEYNFALTSAQMAGQWAALNPDYNLQYRTAADERVRDTHAALHDITLPIDDPFWLSYYPPNGWGCRCDAVQVPNGKYEETNPEIAITRGEAATSQIGKDGKNRLEIFRFNPGVQKVIFPPNHPYNKVSGADVVKAEVADTSHLDDRVFRYTGYDAIMVKERPFYSNAMDIAPNLRPAEVLGINRYTGSYYNEMNKYLRAGRIPPKNNLDALIGVTDSGLDKLPSFKGTSYRGARLAKDIQDAYENAFKTGKPYLEPAYMSTSNDFTRKFDGNTVFKIVGKNGKSVKALSEFPTEEEVLYKQGSQFKVKSFIRNDKGVEIELEEL
ncbi:phage minor head protein [Flavobacterium rivuli]|uniref:phage minor head protein n=1 Tax=Flavobacterium rivuli TaxID=498301 RepID=UPI0003A81238|nr:phage minor head protein [Flavobacterium rivuli]